MNLNHTRKILREVVRERFRQVHVLKYTDLHDAGHTLESFAKFIEERTGRLQQEYGSPMLPSLESKRKAFIQIAALAVAAIEKIDRENKE